MQKPLEIRFVLLLTLSKSLSQDSTLFGGSDEISDHLHGFEKKSASRRTKPAGSISAAISTWFLAIKL